MINLMPRDVVFFDLFEELSSCVKTSAEHLQSFVRSFPDVDGDLQRIRSVEHRADEAAHRTLDRLDRVFITPFDREDIHMLVERLDDIIDSVDALAKRFPIFHVVSIGPEFHRQVEVLVRATGIVDRAVHRLRKGLQLSALRDDLIEIHHQESIGDDNHHAALSRLFGTGDGDPLDVIKWRELHEYIEEAIDGCEDVGNALERIALKNG